MSLFQSLLADGGRDLFIIIGDSTACSGTNNNTGPGPTPTANTAFYYRRDNNTVIPIEANDLEFAADPPADGSWAPQFAISYYTFSRRKAVVIPCGVNSSTFSDDGVDNNDWSTTGDNYAPMVADAQATMLLTGVNHISGIFISLGVNDANGAVTLATVQTDIASLVSRLHTDFPGTPIIFNQIGTMASANTNARSATIRKYIKDICISDAGCYLVGGMLSALSMGYYVDGFHLNQDGQNQIGAIFSRWFENRNYRKWSRSIICSLRSDLSVLRKNLIEPIDDLLTDYFSHEMLYFFVQPQEQNAYLDWTFNVVFNNGIGGAETPLVFNVDSDLESVAAGDNTARGGWVPSISGLTSSQNDVFFAVKIKTATTALNTFGTVYGGLNAGSTIGNFLAQTTASAIRYRINDVTNTDYSGQAKFQNDTEYLVMRNGTTKALWINGSQVHSVVQASTGVFDTSANLSSNNAASLANSFYVGEFEWLRSGKHSTVNQPAFLAYLENIRDHWND